MNLLKVFGAFVVISTLFFYPIFKGYIPFPGDLLLNFHEPYKAYPIAGYPPGGVPSKMQGSDVLRQMLPWKNFVTESIKGGDIPFWNPHNFSGNPFMANFQSGVFYPFNLVLLALPFLAGWTIYIISTPILASFFTYLFLRELKLSKLSSFFSGILFGFSSFMVVWMEYGNLGHTFLWLPLALLWTEKLINKFRYRYLIFLTLTFTMSILAGFIQTSFYLISAVLFYFLAKSALNKALSAKLVLLFFASIAFASLFSFFQLFPTIELFSHSSRGSYTLTQLENLLNPWWYTITTIAPNFFGHPASGNHWFYGTYIERVSYIGLIPLIFSIYAAFNFRKRKEILIFGVLALFTLIIATDLFITKYFHTIPLPVISTAVPTRILSLFQFSAIVLAAFGLDYFRKLNKKSLKLPILIVILTLLLSWAFTFFASGIFNVDKLFLSVSQKNLLIPTGLTLAFILGTYFWFKLKKQFIIWAILFLTIIDLFYFFHRITPFSPKEFIYPETPVIGFLKENAGVFRFWGYGSGYVESNFQIFDKTYSPEGYDAIHIKEYTELLASSRDGAIPKVLPRPDANIAPGYGKENLRENPYRQRLLNLLGVKYVLHKIGDQTADNETFSLGTYNFIYHDGYYQIYENKEVLPRAFLASDYVVLEDKQEIVNRIYDPSFNLRETVILEEKVPSFNLEKDEKAKAEIVSYKDNRVEILTSSRENMLLFISDTFYPQWNVRVDGKDAKIYRANLAFRAVPVGLGDHTVIFEYKGDSFKKGLYISLGSALAFLALTFYLLKIKNVKF